MISLLNWKFLEFSMRDWGCSDVSSMCLLGAWGTGVLVQWILDYSDGVTLTDKWKISGENFHKITTKIYFS